MKSDPLAIRPIEVQPVPRISLREPEAAKAMGVSASWLRREAGAGRVPSVLIAGVRLYAVDELRLWLADKTQRRQADAGVVGGGE